MYEFLFGVLVGSLTLGPWGYRYYLKKDPEKLEAWARQIKALRERARAGK